MTRSTRVAFGILMALSLVAPGLAEAALAQPAVLLQWTIDGQPVGPPVMGPPGANDVHLIGIDALLDRMVWTRDGGPIGPPVEAPEGANDLHLFWDPATGAFRRGVWTKDGVRLGRSFRAPGGANDAHAFLVAGQFKGAIWTMDRQRIGRALAPQGANDVHVQVML